MKSFKTKHLTPFYTSGQIFSTYKTRSLWCIIILSILLGLTAGLSLLSRGLENATLAASVAGTGGRAYLVASCQQDSSTCLDDLTALVARYHGDVIGTRSLYQAANLGSYIILSQSAAAPFVTTDSTSASQISVLISPAVDPDTLPTAFTVAGVLPEVSSRSLGLDGPHLSNIFLRHIDSGPTYHQILIDDGSGLVSSYLAGQFAAQDLPLDAISVQTQSVITFEHTSDARSFQLAARGNGDYMSVSDLFSNTAMIVHFFHSVQIIISLISVIVIIASLFIASYLLTSILKSPRQARSASPQAYASYMVIVSLGTLIGAAIIASLTLFSIYLLDASALSRSIQDFYRLTQPVSVYLCGFSISFWWLVATVFLLAPITLLLNLDRLVSRKS